MGLREKTLDFLKNSQNRSELALRPLPSANERGLPEPSIDWESEAIDELKKKGKVSSNELIERLSRFKSEKASERAFLLSDDIRMLSQPVDLGFSQQDRLEALYNLLDLCKELCVIDKEEELWGTLLFGLLGQIGSREAAIFFRNEQSVLELKAVKGFIIDREAAMDHRQIDELLLKDNSLHYCREIFNKIKTPEKEWLEGLNAELLIPLMRYEEVTGFIILGKPIGLSDYTLDDLLYLKLFGELVGSFYDSITRILYVSEQKRLWEEREKKYARRMIFLEQIQNSPSFEESELVLKDILFTDYGLSMYMLLLEFEQVFTPRISTGFKQKTIDQFQVPEHEPWLWESGHMREWFEYKDFKKDLNLYERFAAEDYSVLEKLYLLPLHFNGKLKAVFVLADVLKALTREDLKNIQSILTNYFLSLYSLNQEKFFRERLHIEQSDPLFALRKLIDEKEKKLRENSVPFSIISLKISNLKRLENLLGIKRVHEIKFEIKKLFAEKIAADQYLAEVFSGHFLLILDGYESPQAQSLVNTVFKEIRLKYPLEETRPLALHYCICRPADAPIDLDQFLFQ